MISTLGSSIIGLTAVTITVNAYAIRFKESRYGHRSVGGELASTRVQVGQLSTRIAFHYLATMLAVNVRYTPVQERDLTIARLELDGTF